MRVLMAARETVTVDGYHVESDADFGWRCNCALWVADGRGCIHTAQVASLDVLTAEAEKLRRSSSPPPLRRDWLLRLQGPIATLVKDRGLIDFEVGSRWLTLVASRLPAAASLREGQCVEVLARERPTAGYHDVLAIRLPEDGIARYTGFLPHRGIGVLTVMAGLAELSRVMWLMLPAAVMLIAGFLVYGLCWRQRVSVMRRLRSKGAVNPPVAKPGRAT
jgi:hypothetical protein